MKRQDTKKYYFLIHKENLLFNNYYYSDNTFRSLNNESFVILSDYESLPFYIYRSGKFYEYLFSAKLTYNYAKNTLLCEADISKKKVQKSKQKGLYIIKSNDIKYKEYKLIDDFPLWFDKNNFNYKFSGLLPIIASNYFNLWWDKEKYDYEEHSQLLPEFCPNYFDIWWDKEKFNFNYIDSLIYITSNCSDKYHVWFNKEWFISYRHNLKFDLFFKYLSQYFTEWFDKETFDYKEYSDYLPKYCPEHFNLWWDEKKYNFEHGFVNLIKKFPELTEVAIKNHPLFIELKEKVEKNTNYTIKINVYEKQ